MVIYSQTSKSDLEDILYGLITWKKHSLLFEHAKQYVSEIRSVCDSLDTKAYHLNVKYSTHRQFGEKVYAYHRNRLTTWYIIYDIDLFGNVLINKIISNYMTII
jgi:plasmid stabilization system protein ParE